MLDGLAAAGRRSERGVEFYRTNWRLYLEPDLGHLSLAELTSAHLSALLRKLRARRLSESTLYGALLVVRALYRLAVRRGLISRSPLDGLDPAELPRPQRGGVGRVLTETELAALARHASDYYRPIVTLLSFSGMRISEAAGLRWADVDFVEGEITVRNQLSRPRKGEPSKLVAVKTRASLRAVLLRCLEAEQREDRGHEGDYVFCTLRGTPLQ